MRILGLDATGEDCTACLRAPGAADLILSESLGRGHAERLAPMTAEVLAQAGIAPGEIDRIAVAVGPGSFAGARVGVAFARGLALATGADCLGLSNLEILARMQDARPLVAVLHDCGRGEVVAQLYREGVALAPPERIPSGAAAAWVADAARSGEDEAPWIAGSGRRFVIPDDESPETARRRSRIDPAALLALAAEARAPFAPPAPFYARPADAKLPGA